MEELKLAKITLVENENKHKCSSSTLCILVFSIILLINVGIGTYFVYYKYKNCDKKSAANKSFNYQTTFHYWSYKMTADVKSINIKNRTYYVFDDMINVEEFDTSLLKIDKKSYKNIGIYNIG